MAGRPNKRPRRAERADPPVNRLDSKSFLHSLDSAVQAVDEFCIDLMRDLVRTPSVTGDEKTAQDKLAAALRELGLELDIWSPTLADVEDHHAFSDDGTSLGERPVIVARW